jgi:hypothetical protein
MVLSIPLAGMVEFSIRREEKYDYETEAVVRRVADELKGDETLSENRKMFDVNEVD